MNEASSHISDAHHLEEVDLQEAKRKKHVLSKKSKPNGYTKTTTKNDDEPVEIEVVTKPARDQKKTKKKSKSASDSPNSNGLEVEQIRLSAKRTPEVTASPQASPRPKTHHISSLRVLCSQVICQNVHLYKGTQHYLSNTVLQNLLNIMSHFKYLTDKNFAFFLSESYHWLDITIPPGGNEHFTDKSLQLLPFCCMQLTRLSLNNCTNFSTKGWRAFCEAAVANNLNKTLHSLSLAHSRFDVKAFQVVAQTFTNLLKLDVSGCLIIKHVESMEVLLQHVGPQLVEFRARDVNLPAECLHLMAERLPKLQLLDLTMSKWEPHQEYAPPEALAALSSLKLLRKLYLGGNKLNDECIKSIGASCISLEVLDLSWPDPKSQYVWSVKVGDAAVTALINCTLLRELGLGFCSRIRNEQSLLTLVSVLPHLEKLNLTSVPVVTDNLVIRIAESCSGMRRLKLQNCVLNSVSLFALAKHCSKLQYLDVRSKNTLLPDSAWEAIADGCKEVQTVLGYMSTDARLYLQLNCPNLQMQFHTPKRELSLEEYSTLVWSTTPKK